MAQYAANNKQMVRLGALLGKGGEGEVYLVEGAGDQVAKIYHATHRTAQRQHKLQAMLANPPQDDTRRLTPPHVSIAWPLEVLYERQQFAGFLMPRIDQSPTIFTIFNPSLRSRRYPAFDWRYLHRTAANLAAAMNVLHARNYVVGDVNQKNVLVTPSAMVTWVDTDSFQVPDLAGRSPKQVYRCPVGVPDYTPPELQGVNLSTVDRQTEHDCFGLAVMIFQLLMQGYHPFTGILQSGVAAPTGEIFRHNIERGIFPHQPNPQCIPPPAAPALAALHPTLQQFFIRAFVDGHHKPSSRPTAREWLDGIERAEQMLVQCKQDSTHWYSSHYGQCHWCVPHSQSKTALPLQKPLPSAAQHGLEWVTVPAGEFTMGSNDSDGEKPIHRVHLSAYQIARHPVTNAQYELFVKATSHAAPQHWKNGKIPAGKEKHPVVNVSWQDAQAFCVWAGVRLPTEAEWEKAARGADGRKYPWGNEPPTKELCNFNRNVGDTTPVGRYPKGASPYGVLDMAGNVWEWVSDWYDEKYYSVSPGSNPPGPAAGERRVLRGGSWDNYDIIVRSAYRDYFVPDRWYFLSGFRCVRSQ